MKNKVKCVLDTNIFLNSWLNANESCDRIIQLIKDNKIKLYFSQDTIGEIYYMAKQVTKNVTVKDDGCIKLLDTISRLFYHSASVNASKIDDDSSIDPEDRMFMECAIKGNVDYFITDDFKHGLHGIEGYTFLVLSSAEFVKLYKK